MNERPEDKMQAAWSSQTTPDSGISIAALQAMAAQRDARMRWRDRRLYAAAAIIIPSWLAALYWLPDLRFLATSGLLLGLWLTWQQHRRSGARLRQDTDLPCAAFQRQLIKRELDLYAAMPGWFLAPVIAGQAMIVFTLLTNPRFQNKTMFVPGLVMFVTTVVVALVIAWRRWRGEARQLHKELAALDQLQ